jgi:hypothetical protein
MASFVVCFVLFGNVRLVSSISTVRELGLGEHPPVPNFGWYRKEGSYSNPIYKEVPISEAPTKGAYYFLGHREEAMRLAAGLRKMKEEQPSF